ncbi:lytic transglycosylase domain-containing protein [Roseomonas genomospecies 6]|uniref:Murein transglycosylase n=1 Tax=Roseomonas genomospecies 6 TaxID=214106 RepID=A0A9W7NLJ1_9PROT|nr:lytic transglycosylase domain-containing protein [Roseomonas genomospecies 6]KAA0682305.1 murein transglycosylase [Roseomonas genomospecies 6]
MRAAPLLLACFLAGFGALSAPAALAAGKSGAVSSRETRMADCEAAEKGDPEAAYRTARRFLFGVGVKRDRRVGTAWLRAAASRGHKEARRLVAYVPGRMGHVRPWCRPGAAPLREALAPPPEIVALVHKTAPQYGLDPALVMAVIRVESAFRSDAVSPKEAAGLMQLIPDTAERFGVSDVFDPAQNIRGGVRYLRWLLAYFQGDVTLALAGYNAGERAVDRFRGVPPYEETRNYVRAIRRLYDAPRHPFDAAAAEPSPLVTRQAAELARPGKG